MYRREGNVSIAGRSQEEDDLEVHESKFIERTTICPGNVVLRGICGCEILDT
jgi:hypothetical protein